MTRVGNLRNLSLFVIKQRKTGIRVYGGVKLNQKVVRTEILPDLLQRDIFTLPLPLSICTDIFTLPWPLPSSREALGWVKIKEVAESC